MANNRAVPITMRSPPDFVLCDPRYGTVDEGINIGDCSHAVDRLPTSSTPVEYHLDGSTPPFIFPWQARFGLCHIAVETGGPWIPSETITVVPDTIRSIASSIISECVQPDGVGGFATAGLDNVLSYLTDPTTNWGDPYPASSTYITVMITNGMIMNPGDTDPATSRHLAGIIEGMATRQPPGALRDHYQNQQAHLLQASLSMDRGDTINWWAVRAPGQGNMGYTCDASFGSPRLLDCSQVAYSQLGYPSDTIKLTAREPKLLSSNTCTVQILSTIVLTLTWAQIKAALDSLIEICLDDPAQVPKGGIAFWEHQAPNKIGQSSRKRSTGANTVTGLDALPQNVNITIWEKK